MHGLLFLGFIFGITAGLGFGFAIAFNEASEILDRTQSEIERDAEARILVLQKRYQISQQSVMDAVFRTGTVVTLSGDDIVSASYTLREGRLVTLVIKDGKLTTEVIRPEHDWSKVDSMPPSRPNYDWSKGR